MESSKVSKEQDTRLVEARMKEVGLQHGSPEGNESEIKKAQQAMSCGDF